jgi:GT2 family glycosyltransferase
MSVSIIIPVYNQYILLHQLLYDIYQKCSTVDEIVIVNDFSTDEEVRTGLDWWRKLLPIKVLENKENLGFLKSSNAGLRKATGDIKILISTDVRIYGDIVEKICAYLDAFPKSLIGGVVYKQSTGWNKFGNRVFPYAEGWLLAMLSSGWEDADYFDERYAPFDFEDVCLSTKVLSLGYSLYELPIGIAHHMGGKSIGYGEEREKLTRQHQKIFERQWVKHE